MTPDREERLFVELGQIHGGVREIAARQDAHEERDDERNTQICVRLDKLETAREQTGSHDLAAARAKVIDLEAAEAKRISDAKARRADWIKGAVMIFVGGLITLLGSVVAHALKLTN